MVEESAFKGTQLEGRERRYTVLNERDLKKYLSDRHQESLNDKINTASHWVQQGRIEDGKNPFNNYIVINLDEPYVDEVIEVMKKHGHWRD